MKKLLILAMCMGCSTVHAMQTSLHSWTLIYNARHPSEHWIDEVNAKAWRLCGGPYNITPIGSGAGHIYYFQVDCLVK